MNESPVTSSPEVTPRKGRPVWQSFFLMCLTMAFLISLGLPFQLWNIIGGLAATELLLILAPALAFVALHRMPLRQALRLYPVSPKVLFWAACVGIGGNRIVLLILIKLTPIIGEMPDLLGLADKVLSPLQIIMLLVAAALLPGLCEEILFRGAIQGMLLRRGRWFAIILTSVLFGLFHMNIWQFIAGLFLGLLFGIIVEFKGSILPAMVGHATANAAGLILHLATQEKGGSLEGVILWPLEIPLMMLAPIGMWQLLRTRTPVSTPLATSLPPLRPAAWLLQAVPVLAVVMLIAGLVSGMYGIYRQSTSWLEPEIKNGDLVVTLNPRLLRRDIAEGDVVAFQNGRVTWLRRVLKVESDTLLVQHEDQEHPVLRTDIKGKVIKSMKLDF